MVELEFLNEFRDYKLHIKYKNKALKKINRAYKAGKINEEDWKAGVLLYKETKERCERQL